MIVGGASSAWGTDVTYTFSSKAWAASDGTGSANWTSGKDGNSYNNGVQVTTGASGANATSPSSFSNVSNVRVYYHTNASDGVGTIKVKVGTGTEKSFSVTKPAKGTGTTSKYTDFSFSNLTGNIKLTVECTSNSVYIEKVVITYTAGFTVAYDANGATSGTAPTDASSPYSSGATVTVLGNTGSLAKTGYTFDGWNTKDDGTGTTYSAGVTFEITADVTLYAKWNAKTAAGLAYETTSYNVFPGASFDTPTLTNPNSLDVSYSSSNTSVATVNVSTGAVTVGTTEGTATITASSSETSTYAAGSASYTITVAKGATTVILSDDSWTANILDGATKELTATAKYSETTLDSPAITWSSSNTSVATVSGGVVTPVAPGSATIRASYAGTTTYASSYADCAVTVNKANTTLTLNEDEIEQDLKDGRSFALTPTVKASKSDDSEVTLDSPTVTWTSSDETVATVSDGVVTGLKAGTTTITASYAGGDLYNAATNATCSVTLTDTRTGVSISTFTADKTTLVIGDEQATTITNDQAGWTAAYTYSSSDEDVATVDENGVITAVAKGTATITATINISLSETGYKEGTTTSKTLDITVTKPFHTATFWVNGDVTRTASVEEDQAITFPTAVETTPGDGEFPKVINGKTFVGWYTDTYSHATTAPSPYVNTATATMSTSDVTYYAVYATVSGGEVDASLTNSEITTNFTNTTMAYGTAKTYNDTSDGISWEIAGFTDATGRPWIQQKKHEDSYIKIAAAGNITEIKVKITSASNTSGGIADISKHTAYSGYVYLESSASSSPSGTYGSSNTVSSNIVTLTPSSSVSTLYVQVGSGARVWDIDVTYDNSTASAFTTDARADAGIAYANAEVDVKLTSDYTGQALTNPNSLTVSYSSSDATVATVNSSTGAITELKKAGSTTITATFAGNATYKPAEVSYTLNVTEKTPAGLAYANDVVEKVTTDDAFTNTLTNGYSLTVSYSSSETGVATVNASTGEVTIKGAGETTITATFAGNEDYEAGSASYTLTVSKAIPTLSFASDNAIGRKGEAFAGNALTNPANLTVSYSSSDTDVATVNSSTGAVTIVAAGTTTITASFAGNDTYTSGSASYMLKVLDTPTITVSNQTIAWGETFTYNAASNVTGGPVTVTSGNTSIATVDGLKITPVACGEVTITVSTAEDETYKAGSNTFTLTVTAPAGSTTAPSTDIVVFYESFDTNTGTGGNDDSWNGSIASSDFEANNTWTTTNAKGADACAKFGTSGAGGSAITPEINLEEDIIYTLTFKAGAWDGKSEGTSLSLSASNATIKNEANTATVSSVTTSKGKWTSYTLKVIVTDESDPVKITFSTDGGNKRFFLDEVKVFYEQDPTTTVTLNKDGYATYCSVNPMDFSSTTGYTAWRVSNIDESGVITFTKITEKIKGGQGVLLYNKNADGEKTSTATIKFADGTTEFTSSENLLVGTTAPTFVEQEVDDYTNFALSSSNSDFRKIKEAGMVVPANKAYLPVLTENIPAGARLTFVFEDDQTTTIQGVSVRKTASDTYYNLKGQRVDNPKKGGIYVKNGKKVIFK